MDIRDFDYKLPHELIAQHPSGKREQSRLMVLNRGTGEISHRNFFNIMDYLNPGDCLVLNNSRVIPARLLGFKEETGAKIELLLIKRAEGDIWEAMVKPGKKLHAGDRVILSSKPDCVAEIVDCMANGNRHVRFIYEGEFLEILEKIGRLPLPPYIERDNEVSDKERYQTVYCEKDGSIAAPTAGLHFTEALLAEAVNKGVHLAYVTLHVGIGTFRPVKCDVIEEHSMHFEEYEIDDENADLINSTRLKGGRIVAVGTTSTRTLESASGPDGVIRSGLGDTDIFIYPGYKFKVIDSLITNFHLPKSTLLMLISAFYDREKILAAYDTAIKEKYRFFSYGDAMLII